ncbi:MAG: LapA family protein [Chitinispirillaceae bacterium]|nr:LapA family protein [Chitinispirillaceae bacterium]
MKILKWLVVFIVAFFFAWILIFTFTQEQFKQVASARILTYWTPAIPIYFYVAGAFGVGLLLGLFAAFYYYIVLQSKVHRRTKDLRELEEKLAEARRTLEQCEMTHKTDGLSIPEPELLEEEAFPEEPVEGESSKDPA